MTRGKSLAVLWGVVGGLGCAPAIAQHALEDLHQQPAITPAEARRLDGWILEQVSRAESGIVAGQSTAQATLQLQATLRQALRGSGIPFQRVFAERCTEQFLDRIRSTNGLLSRVLMGGLRTLEHPATLRAFEALAAAPDVVVRMRAIRYTAALGRSAERFPADRLAATLAWLAAAGGREKDALVLQDIYFAITDIGADRAQQAASILAVLEARSPGPVTRRTEAADAAAFTLLRVGRDLDADADDLASALDAADQVRAVRIAAARFSTYCRRMLTTDARDISPQLVRVTVTCEALLTQMTSVRGDVTAAISGPKAERPDRVRLALEAWVGSAQVQGALNGGRWQVPVGGG